MCALRFLIDQDISPNGWASQLKSVIFLCVFFILVIVAFIWWLRR
jgi:hypothetical protein